MLRKRFNYKERTDSLQFFRIMRIECLFPFRVWDDMYIYFANKRNSYLEHLFYSSLRFVASLRPHRLSFSTFFALEYSTCFAENPDPWVAEVGKSKNDRAEKRSRRTSDSSFLPGSEVPIEVEMSILSIQKGLERWSLSHYLKSHSWWKYSSVHRLFNNGYSS